MKKLIVFAAVAALGLGAMAGACDECTDLCDETPQDHCLLWNVTLKLKTLQTDAKKTAIKNSSSGGCSDTPVCSDCYMLKDVTRTFKGVLWLCETACVDEETDLNFVLWDTKNKYPISQPLVTGTGTYTADTLKFTQLGLYTKKANKVVAFWEKEFADVTITKSESTTYSYPAFGKIYAAGTKGSITKVNDENVLKSISGNAVGMINPTIAVSNKCSDDTTITGVIAKMCDCYDDNICAIGTEATQVAASGTWSIKYNKSLSKGKKTLAKIVPSYAQSKGN